MKRWDEKTTCVNALRRAFSRSPLVIEILKEGKRTRPRYKKDGTRHKIDAAEYQCQVCNNWVGSKNIQVDHIIPVVDPKVSFVDYNTYQRRLFCDKKNLQRICKLCHKNKSQTENRERQATKDTPALLKLQERLLKDDPKLLRKELKKYLSKTKATQTQEQAKKLLELLQVRVKKGA